MAFAQNPGHTAAEFRIFQVLGLEVGVDGYLPGQHGQELGIGRFFENDRIVPHHQPLRRRNRFRWFPVGFRYDPEHFGKIRGLVAT